MKLIVNTPALTVYEHMALDETLVALRPAEITLRFYHWTPAPAVTFGYAQAVRSVRALAATQGIEKNIARRPTGGGVVFHVDDLTFSLIFPSALRPAEIYAKFHTCVNRMLAHAGALQTRLEGAVDKAAYRPGNAQGASACFINPVENDVLGQSGEKILGGALRRFSQTVLYQGSLQLPDARQNPVYKHAIIDAARHFFAQDFQPMRAQETWLARARQLARTQYESAAWEEKF